jgi:tartrate dehydrogenase/decarboxylase/D-malate dehydrogenase
MFEPVHGSAPDIVGTGRANPLATVVAGAMMLNFLGETQAARRVEAAVIGLLEHGQPLTPDLGGTASTDEVGTAVVEQLAS